MIKARVNHVETEFNVEGSAAVIAIEAEFLMYDLINVLKRTGRTDDFIRSMFEINMKHTKDE